MADKKTSSDFEVIIRLRQADWGGNGREPDPTRDLFSVWIKGHSICQPGKAYRVAYTGEKVVDANDVQIRGNINWLFDPSGEYSGPNKKLRKADLNKIAEYIAKWQQSPELMAASREDQEVTI